MPESRKGRRLALAWVPALAAIVVFAGLAAPALAQQVEREVQIPVDSLRAVVEITPELRRELGLFPEIRDFVAARLFVTTAGREILEVSYRENGRLVRERRAVTAADLEALRSRIGTRMADRGMGRAVERDGRGGLVLAETALGLGFYGWALPEVLGIDSDRGRVATYLLTAGASFLLPYQLTRSIPVREAHRDAVVWGGTRGILYGLLLGDALTGGEEPDPEVVWDPVTGQPDEFGGGDEGNDDKVILGLGILGSLAGQVLGYTAVERTGADAGDVALWSTVGDLSLAYGFGTSYVLGLYDGDPDCQFDVCYEDEFQRTPAGHAGTMAVGLAGLWAARRWSRQEDYTVGDARALLSAGVLGAQTLLPLAWAVFENDDREGGEKPFTASIIAGSAGGLWLGNRILRDYALTPSEGLLVQAGHVAGGLAALGITYLVDTDLDGDELLYFTTSTLGSLAGAYFTFRAVAKGSEAERSGASGEGGGARGLAASASPPRDRSPTVEVSALGAAPVLLQGMGGGEGGAGRTRLPLVTVRW